MRQFLSSRLASTCAVSLTAGNGDTTGMTVDQLANLYPHLFHMAADGAWASIQQHGLLPTSHLVETSRLTATQQAQLLEFRRVTSTAIDHPVYGRVTIRDQAPLRPDNLTKSLTDMTISEWLRILNERVFFWLHPDRLHRLLGARLYRSRQHDVLTIDTRSLVETHLEKIPPVTDQLGRDDLPQRSHARIDDVPADRSVPVCGATAREWTDRRRNGTRRHRWRSRPRETRGARRQLRR